MPERVHNFPQLKPLRQPQTCCGVSEVVEALSAEPGGFEDAVVVAPCVCASAPALGYSRCAWTASRTANPSFDRIVSLTDR